MSQRDSTGFPWGDNIPTRRQRISVAALVASIAACFVLAEQHRLPLGHGDFSVVWYGAGALIAGRNPYELIGPGRVFAYDFTLHYPATALVVAIPFSFLSEHAAGVLFAFLSAGLLAYGATKENWNRVWIFPSAAFIVAARSTQWSPLIASAYFLPSLGWALSLKPSIGLAVLSSSGRRTWIACLAGGIALSLVAFILFPAWPVAWLKNISGTWEFSAPVTRFGGFLIPLALLRWKQREARFLFVLALIPQVSSWYEALLPMLVARTKREVQFLSLVSSLGYLLLVPMAIASPTKEIASSDIGRMMVAFCYLPALIVVLRRAE